MQSHQQIHIHNFINSNLNTEILFSIMIRLDVKQLILLWFAAKHSDRYWKKMDGISNVISNNLFWKENAKNHLKSNQISDLSNHQKVMLDRYFSYRTIKNHLDKSEFFSQDQNFFGKFTGIYSGFGNGIKSFTIRNIETYLVNDDADSLFNCVINLPGLLALVKYDNDNVKIIQRYMDENEVEGKHIGFLGLLPCIIDMRAVKCFDLFIRTYLELMGSGKKINHSTGENNSEKYYFSSIIQLVFQFNDAHFTKQFIHFAIRFRDVSKEGFFMCIQTAIDAKYYDLLRNSFNCISKEKFTTILNACESQSISRQLLLDIYLGYKYKTSLKPMVDAVFAIDNNEKNVEQNLDKLIKLRSQIDSCLSQWIQDLRDKFEENQEYKRIESIGSSKYRF